MPRIIPPLCLFLALASIIAGFTLISLERPQPSVALHEARIGSDERQREVLESQLQRKRRQRTYLTAGLFTSGVIFFVAAFVVMRPAGTETRAD